MTHTVLAPWTMPSEVVKSFPVEYRKVAETCYAHLNTIIEYNGRRWTFMTASAIGLTAFFTLLISHPRWKLLFVDLSPTDMIALYVGVAVISGILGWKAGSMKGRAEATAAKQTLLAHIWHGGLKLEVLAHMRDRDPREEYRDLLRGLFNEANEGYDPSDN